MDPSTPTIADSTKNILKIVSDLSDYSLKDQAKRAALSIILNIAEGSAMKSDKEFARYLEKKDVVVKIRRSRGKDIDAACGQLANKEVGGG